MEKSEFVESLKNRTKQLVMETLEIVKIISKARKNASS